MKTSENKLQSRDFISIGVFTLIYAAVTFVVGGVSQMTPVTFPLMPAAVACSRGRSSCSIRQKRLSGEP